MFMDNKCFIGLKRYYFVGSLFVLSKISYNSYMYLSDKFVGMHIHG